ncbi:MAG: hypothetical protein AAGA92_02195 [Planctomycetota bacterium]
MSNSRARGLRIEALEPKQPLAGDVMVSVDAGVLSILGDELGNQVAITGGESPGTYVVSGGPGTNVVYSPGDGSGPQAPQAAVEVSGVRSVRAAMGEGDDTLSINDARFRGNVRVATGQGEDRVFVGVPLPPPPGPVPADSSMADAATPDDPPSSESGGMVSIVGGLSIHTGADNDVAVVGNARVRRAISLAGGEGADDIRLTDTASRVLRVYGGRGEAADTIGLTGVDAVMASIAAGDGADEVGVQGSRFGGLKVALGAGDDTFSVGETDAAFAAFFGGAGESDEVVRLGGNRFGRAFIRGFELPVDGSNEQSEQLV